MTYHVHLGYTPAPHLLDTLQNQLHGRVVLSIDGDVPPNTQLLIAGRPTRAQLDASDQLAYLLIPFAGLPAVTQTIMRSYPHIAIHNLHHNSSITAEMAITLLMAAARLIVPAHNTFKHGDWSPRYAGGDTAIMLDGKTVLILGYGAIGQRVGAVCRAMGMRVIGVRRTPNGEPDVYPPDALPDLLPQANALIIALPGTPATDGLIGAAELALLPPRAVLVNIGRAAVIDETALYNALANGQLHAAGLDVWYQYPPDEASRTQTYPATHPFWELDNVVLSPHRGGALHNADVEQMRMDGLAAAINAAAVGETPPHPVDLRLGY